MSAALRMEVSHVDESDDLLASQYGPVIGTFSQLLVSGEQFSNAVVHGPDPRVFEERSEFRTESRFGGVLAIDRSTSYPFRHSPPQPLNMEITAAKHDAPSGYRSLFDLQVMGSACLNALKAVCVDST